MTERQFDVPAVARDVAIELGEGWSASPGVWDTDEDAFLEGPGGLTLHMRHNKYINKGQFQIGLALRELYDFRSREKSVSDINASVTKMPRQIAGEITRRLLDKAIPVFREALARKRAHDEREAATVRLAEDIRSAIGGSARVNKSDHQVRLGEYGDETRVEVDPRHGSIVFRVETTPERAIALAQAIGRL